jgi:hypothetical protein
MPTESRFRLEESMWEMTEPKALKKEGRLMNRIPKELQATKDFQLGLNSARRAEGVVSRRAQSLANRIELGADVLASFVTGLSETEWNTPVSATDRRSIGLVVHHVASMYPIEIEVARRIASGNAVADVTWDVVAKLNAQHAQDHAGVTKTAALELLRRNSRQAADAVRAFSDDELDQTAPFSLSYGAPVTAQFVIEDHALRHSWHHLARIQTAVGR